MTSGDSMVPPVGWKSLAAKVLVKALKWAQRNGQPTITEADLIQQARVLVAGSGNVVFSNQTSYSYEAARAVAASGDVYEERATRDYLAPGEIDFRALAATCFELVLANPGLSLTLVAHLDGSRSLTLSRTIGGLPSESDLLNRQLLPAGPASVESGPAPVKPGSDLSPYEYARLLESLPLDEETRFDA